MKKNLNKRIKTSTEIIMKILIYMIIKLALCCWLIIYFFLGKESPFNHVFKNFRKSIGLDT